jgi:Phage tail assembly chaperone
MFRLQPNPTFTAEVKISTPQGVVPLKLEFKHMGKKALGEWTEASKGKPDIEVLGPVVSGWSDVFDCNGEPVPFSYDALAQLLGDYSPAAREIFMAYVLALTESRSKN